MEKTRHCPRCDTDKPEQEFRPNPRTGQFRPYCPSCTKAYRKERYAKSPETRRKAIDAAKRRAVEKAAEVKAYQDAYRASHRQKLNQRAATYRQENKEEISARRRLSVASEEQKERMRQRYAHRRATEPAYCARLNATGRKASRKHYRKNKASVLEAARAKRAANPELLRERTRISVAKWYKSHPEKAAAEQAKRNALRRGAVAEGFDDTAHYAFLELWQQGRCYHCGVWMNGRDYQRDHLVAVKRGGEHSADNLALTCGNCNNSKHAKILWQEWVPPLRDKPDVMFLSGSVPVVSTFGLSERWLGSDAVFALSKIREARPGSPLFFDWEWLRKRSAVENILSVRDGSANVIQARKTQSVELESETARIFLDQYHVQGFGRGTVYTGLVYEDEVVGVCAWLEIGGAVELNRLAFKGRVVGGFSKMVTAFRRNFLPVGMPILSFLDPRYGDGHGYEAIGFEAAGETNAPVYYYTGPSGLFHRRLFTKDAIRRRFPLYDTALTERDLARMNGYYRVYGFPQRRYMLRLE